MRAFFYGAPALGLLSLFFFPLGLLDQSSFR